MGAVPAPELNHISLFFVFALQYAFEIAKVVFGLTSSAIVLSSINMQNIAPLFKHCSVDTVVSSFHGLAATNTTAHMGTDPNLYTAGYTRGFTNDYITGYAQSKMPQQMPIAIVGILVAYLETSVHRTNSGSCARVLAMDGQKSSRRGLRIPLSTIQIQAKEDALTPLTAQEAISMDPQQRMLLECTFEGLDSAGIPKHQVVGKDVGVFIGGSFSEYESQLFSDTEAIPMHQATVWLLYTWRVKVSGMENLRQGGCHLNTLPQFRVSMSKSLLFSDEGRSFSFDGRGTGYGRAEGCGMVILKPLQQALQDNDTIRSVIVGTGINQDGKTPGITMPNGAAQKELMRSVYRSAGINPKETRYVEVHGASTNVSNPIEAAALHNVFGEVAISAPTSFELIEVFNAGKCSPARETKAPRIGFIFTGQGAQWNAMGRELYEQYPVFAATVDACDKCLAAFGAPFSLFYELSKDAESSNINDANISQPACTAVQLALTDLLRAWSIYPSAATGHLSGEIGAAYAAGILPLDACMAISYYRGMVALDLKTKFSNLKGSMMAVGGSQEEIAPLIKQLKNREVRVACFNSPTSLTISGDEPAVDELQVLLEQRQMFNRKLQVDACLHWLEPPKNTAVKFHSSLLGHAVDGSTLQPSYWVANLTQAVRFSEALTTMLGPANGHKTGVNMLVELGPHSALAGPVPYASALIRKKDAVRTAVDLAGALFGKGVTVNIGAVNFPKPGKPPALLVDLPRYPWNHSNKYWHEGRMQQKHKTRTTPRNDILGAEAIYSNDLEPTWRNIVRTDDLPWLQHHKTQSLTLFPMSGFVAMAVEAASQRAASKGVQFDKYELRNIVVSTPLMITDDDVEMTTQLRPYQEGKFVSSNLVAVKTNDSNKVDGARLADKAGAWLRFSISEINSASLSFVDKTKMYNSLSKLGVSYGPTFQGKTTARLLRIVPSQTSQLQILHRKCRKATKPATSFIQPPGNSLRAFCKGSAPSMHPKPIQISMFVASADDSREALIILDDLTISPIVERDMSSANEAHRELCYKVEWGPILYPLIHALKNGVSHGTSNGISTPSEASETSNDNPNGVLTPETNDTSVSGKGSEASSFPDGQIVIVHGDSETQKLLATKIADSLENSTGRRPNIGTLAGILWVVRGAYENSDNPDSNMVTGLSKSIRSETLLKFSTLDLDSKSQLSVEDTMVAILDIFKAFLTPRIVNDPKMNESVHKQTQVSTTESAPFVQEGRLLKMTTGTPSAFETLHFVDDVAAEEPLAEDDVEIEVKAIGMNAKDLSVAMGQLSPFDLGVECSGIVSKTRSAISFAVGDHVAAISLSQGVYSTLVRTKASLVLKISEYMTFEAATAIPVAYCTGLYGLVTLGRLAADESILVHGAASTASQAATSIARSLGAQAFATVANLEEKEILTGVYGLADDKKFSIRNAYFGSAVRQETNRQGVDIVFNSTITDLDTMRETLDCLSSFGRFIEVGKGDASTRVETSRSNTSFMSVDIPSLAVERPKIMQKLLSDVAELLKDSIVKAASPVTIFPISDVETAFKVPQSGNSMDEVKATPSRKQIQLLHPDASYILIRGTSGLRRSMSRWMVSKGTKNIVLVSRSGSATSKVKEMIDELALLDANVVVRRCDVADSVSVDNLIANELVGLPPVKGLVHSSMVLRKMTFDEYNSVMEGKVRGAWNFHNALKDQPLDFFVAISSAAGAVGNRGQAAYSTLTPSSMASFNTALLVVSKFLGKVVASCGGVRDLNIEEL
ncbi:hypothetical protein BDZ45DRAFT_755700 [Acephala macrosclerotiorum]|nr:hypothetical protein BDZ45DRAFT_755700 [Acephala macrosclerotiorum]